MTDDRIDEALDRLHATADEFGGGLANHGPMVVEALARLGHVDAVAGWVRRYMPKVEPYDGPVVAPIEGAWRDVVRREVPRLVASAGSAGHGSIRTAHAVALLELADTPVRRTELARALAYWRSTSESVPAGPPAHGRSSARADLLELSGRQRPPQGRPGLISDHLRSLEPVARRAEPASIDDLAAAAATVLAHTRASATIPLVHAVTIPRALEVLDPYLPEGLAVEQAWLVAAALVSAYGDVGAAGSTTVPDQDVDVETAVGVAVEGGDEHAIKLAAAGAPPSVVVEVTRRLA